jgi:regulator of sigma E protease
MQVFYLILSLSILVILHEFGHYITARIFKCRVEKFYLFFNPWFSLVKKQVGDTEYGIGWLPLGGYVKISGMIDESMDKEAMKLPPQPYEFRSKPAWQRLIIMLGGITVNILLAFAIYAMVLFIWGEKKIVNSSLINGISTTDSIANVIGLKNGDNIVAVNGQEVKYFDDISKMILFNGGGNIEVNRNGKDTTLAIRENIIGKLLDEKRSKGAILMPRVPIYMGTMDPGDTATSAMKAGLKPMDIVIAVDSTPVQYVDQLSDYLDKKKNQNVMLTVIRAGKQLSPITVAINEDGKAGIPPLTAEQYDSLKQFKLDVKKYSLLESFPAGVSMAFARLGDYVSQFKLIFQPKTEAYKGLGGFKSIGSVFPTKWGDWQDFWALTAFLSIALAFMNLLPIPALDGGHVLFTLIEMITGRKPSDKFLEYAQVVGMVLLLSLMIYANGNDWFGWGRGR